MKSCDAPGNGLSTCSFSSSGLVLKLNGVSRVTRDTPYGHTLLFVLCSLYLKSNVCLAGSVSLPTVLSMMGRPRNRKGPFAVACFCNGTAVLGAEEIGRR